MTSENALRRRAKKLGYRVIKSRQQLHVNNLGDYQLVEDRRNFVVLGSSYDATLEEIEDFLADAAA